MQWQAGQNVSPTKFSQILYIVKTSNSFTLASVHKFEHLRKTPCDARHTVWYEVPLNHFTLALKSFPACQL